MKITFDGAERDITRRERGIDFAVDAAKVFADRNITYSADRFGEIRFLTVGCLKNRMVLVIWIPRGEDRHVISMRYCHAKEQAKLSKGSIDPPWINPDDVELTDELIDKILTDGEIREGDRVIRPGRPPLGDRAKGTITIRLDPDVLEAYRAMGAGWQTKINADLRKARKLKPIPA